MNQDSNESFENEWPSLSENNDNKKLNENNLTTNNNNDIINTKNDTNNIIFTKPNATTTTTTTLMNENNQNQNFLRFIEPNNTFKPIKNDDNDDDDDAANDEYVDKILSPLKQQQQLQNENENISQMSNTSTTVYQPNNDQPLSLSSIEKEQQHQQQQSLPLIYNEIIDGGNITINVDNTDDVDDDDDDGDDLDPNNLPQTVTILKTDDNKIIYLVGTSHFSKPSHRDVRRVIRKFRPKVVVLELCRSRMCFLSMTETEIMNESKSLNLRKIRDYMKKNGFLQTFIYTLLLFASARVTNDLDIAPGGEFRNAFNEALKIPGCTILLGDRPIDITLRRAISTLNLWQKIKITFHCLFLDEKLKAEELERYKQKDVLEQLVEEFSTEFPGLARVMVDERDLFLIDSLKKAARTTTSKDDVIVGVVGIGHVAGIRDKWNMENIDVNELTKIPKNEPSKTFIVMKYAFYGAISYGIYRYVIPDSIKNWGENLCKQFVGRIL